MNENEFWMDSDEEELHRIWRFSKTVEYILWALVGAGIMYLVVQVGRIFIDG